MRYENQQHERMHDIHRRATLLHDATEDASRMAGETWPSGSQHASSMTTVLDQYAELGKLLSSLPAPEGLTSADLKKLNAARVRCGMKTALALSADAGDVASSPDVLAGRDAELQREAQRYANRQVYATVADRTSGGRDRVNELRKLAGLPRKD